MIIPLDKREIAILGELLRNSRISLTQLAKNIALSREVTTYHFNKLVKTGVIREFVTNIDIEKLGYIGAAVFVNIKADRQQEFEDYLTQSPVVSWVAELSGRWNFGLSLVGRSNAEVHERFRELYTVFKDDIIDHQFALHLRTTFFYEKYLGLQTRSQNPQRNRMVVLDKKDTLILKALAKNSRLEASAIGEQLGLSIPTVMRRIEKLEAAAIIENYSIFLNVRTLGLYQHSVFAENKNVDEKDSMIAYLRAHPAVSFVAEYIGDPFIEFGVFTDDPYQLRSHLQDIEQRFPHNRTIDMMLFQREFVSSGPPLCVFE